MLNLLDYINPIDILIIILSIIAVFGATLLLRPQVEHRDTFRIRKILKKAEQDRKSIAQILSNIQHGAKDTETLSKQLKVQLEQIKKDNETSQSRAESAELTINKAKSSEQELRQISTTLGERIQHIQTYWNDQLEDTTGNVKQIKSRLNQGLVQIDEGLSRLREQEKMAQGFTQKLLQHQKEHLASQQKNTVVSGNVHTQLENILKESTSSLDVILKHQQQVNSLFNSYAGNIRKLEQQANEQFTEAFQSTDVFREEMTSGLQESRETLEKIRQYEVQSNQMHERIKEQFNQVDPLKVERLSETVDLTDEMCVNLQQGLENARALLSTLEAKTAEVIDASEKKVAPINQKTSHDADGHPRNLFSLRANR
ncbi:MAG: Unknown protein [uncultured Thiotrichaceae bacterium]|uniref:Uncharacterized protein n=1 Tax=uncultured Thiotrichaceae bacterium TaxID=298394 RepID=A0A6S6SJ72_9GAMM|nr:MAG: Unknown protein [uncultured Thiotrichaceae bacterium]